MNESTSGTDNELLQRAAAGDSAAMESLLTSQRPRLKRMVAARLDRRIAGRLDPSDVVQEVLARAATLLPEYAIQPTGPLYAWLRQIAWNQLIDLHRQHLVSKKRSVLREEWIGLNDESTLELAKRIASNGTDPGRAVIRGELLQRLQGAMARLPEGEREVLILKYIEQMNSEEIAAVLQLSQRAVQVRHRQALLKLNRWLNTDAV